MTASTSHTAATKARRNGATKDRPSSPFVAPSLRRSVAAPPAFTLVETMVAVTLLSLLAAATALTFTRPLHRARAVEAIEQLRYLDASTRDLARRTGRPARLVFDLDDNTLARHEGPAHEPTFRTTLATPIKLQAVRTADKHDEFGSVAIPISPLALSPSYAIKLSTPDGSRWLLVSGLSGDTQLLTDDTQVQSMLAQAAPRRDAD